MWMQCPWSVSLRTMTWWSEVSEGNGICASWLTPSYGEITNGLCQDGEEHIKAVVSHVALLPELPHSVNSLRLGDARQRQTCGNGYVNNKIPIQLTWLRDVVAELEYVKLIYHMFNSCLTSSWIVFCLRSPIHRYSFNSTTLVIKLRLCIVFQRILVCRISWGNWTVLQQHFIFFLLCTHFCNKRQSLISCH